MTDDKFHKLALNESFGRVAKVAKEREAFNEAMEHVIHSSMPIDFERRYAMDNLIAQDADLIDINNKDSAVLLPCPFCGGVQIEAFHHIDRGWGASWHVECIAEECGNSTCHHDTEATAIAAWNKRQPTQTDALREALALARHRIAGQSASCDLGVGCDEAGVCYAKANGKPEMCHRSTKGHRT